MRSIRGEADKCIRGASLVKEVTVPRVVLTAYPAPSLSLSLSPAVNSISHGIRGVQQKAIKESGGEL